MAKTPKKRSKKSETPPPAGKPELIVVMQPQAGLRASRSRVESATGATVSDIRNVLKKAGAAMLPLFGPDEDRIVARTRAQSEAVEAPLEDQSVYYRVEADEEKFADIAEGLNKQELVEAAYVKPGVELPIAPVEGQPEAAPGARSPDVALPATPDFTARQLYLDPPPAGIDARWAWTQAGGSGRGVRIIDIEGDWRFSHEDLLEAQGGIVGGTPGVFAGDVSWRNHGTAVLGEYSGDRNAFGVTGISPDAVAMAVSHGNLGSAGAINLAAQRLSAGDIILLEMHRPGPRFNFEWRWDQRGYIAVEWWPDDYVAILNASRRGIFVVEAAGNGNENLDDDVYEQGSPWFPPSWRNPFRRVNRDSGAIVVGAGAPPPGTHGRNHGADRSRLGFSNYGSIVDCQGWGREVTTCAYGDLQGGGDEDLWYTDTFSGTSSASPIITGAIASAAGMAAARNKPLPSPARMRNALRTTGTPQQDEPGRPASERIGNRPDMRALVSSLYGSKSFLMDAKSQKEMAETGTMETAQGSKSLLKDMAEGGGRSAPVADDVIKERLLNLEQTVAQLMHFITADLRPDLTGSGGGKHDKDIKDTEKPSDA